jgi:hypothetical protein
MAKVVLMKRYDDVEDETPDDEEAEAKRRRKPLDDDEEAARLRRKNPINHFDEPDPEDALVEKLTAAAIRGAFSRGDVEEALAKRAERLRKPGESHAQAFTRIITQDGLGRQIFKVSRLAPAFLSGDAVQDLAARSRQYVDQPLHTSLEVKEIRDSRYRDATRFRRGVNDPKELRYRLEAATRELRAEQEQKRRAAFR